MPFDNKLLPYNLLAMPSNFFQGIVDQYREKKQIRRPYIGLSIKSATSQKGAFVLKVNTDGPGHVGGIKLGDTIVEIDGNPITNGSDFFKAIGYKLGKEFQIKLERDGKYRTVTVNSS